MTEQSDTPRTDEKLKYMGDTLIEVVFCRTIERELAAKTQECKTKEIRIVELGSHALQSQKIARQLQAENKRLRKALDDIARGMIPKLPPLDDVLEARTQMWGWSQERAREALAESETKGE